MIRSNWWNRGVAAIVAAIAFVSAGSVANADTKPFNVIGAGVVKYVPVVVDVPVEHWAIGIGTDLGVYFGDGAVQLDEFTSLTTANFSSAVPFVFTGAGGDKLVCTYGDTTNGAAEPGQVQLILQSSGKFVAVWLAEFNPVVGKCTGKFKKVSGGSFMMLAVTEPFVLGAKDPVAYGWVGSGALQYK